MYGDLPESFRGAVSDFEEFVGTDVTMVSVGADRDEIVVR